MEWPCQRQCSPIHLTVRKAARVEGPSRSDPCCAMLCTRFRSRAHTVHIDTTFTAEACANTREEESVLE